MSNSRRVVAAMLPAVFGAIALQCAPSDTDAATTASAKTPASAEAVPAQAKSSTVAGLRFVVAPMGNEVRYRIREQLVRVDLPSDAIGKTADITGGIVLALSAERGAVARLVAFERGRVMDEYLSVPEYYGPVPPGDSGDGAGRRGRGSRGR